MSEDDIDDMAAAIQELEPVEISLDITLDEAEVVKFYQLKNEVPEHLLKDAWRAAVKDQLNGQYDNKDQLRQRLAQQGVIDAAGDEDGEEDEGDDE